MDKLGRTVLIPVALKDALNKLLIQSEKVSKNPSSITTETKQWAPLF